MIVVGFHVPIAHRCIAGGGYHAVGYQRWCGREHRWTKVGRNARFWDPCVAAWL